MREKPILTPGRALGAVGLFVAMLTMLLLGPLLPHPALADAAVPYSGADEVILEMHGAYRKGDRARLAALLPRALGHGLEPWAAYWELRTRLGDASSAEVDRFLQRYAGTYQEDRLRNDWMLVLGKQRDWAQFQHYLPGFRMRDDREVRCYALAARAAEEGTIAPEAAADLRRDWYAQRRGGDGCLHAAGLLYRAGRLPAGDVWMKARLAVDGGSAADACAAVALLDAAAAAEMAELDKDPLRYLASRASTDSETGRQLAVLALARAARKDADAAASRMQDGWAERLPKPDRDWLWATIGKWSALELSDRAAGYFKRVAHVDTLDDGLLAWQVRAALRAGDWERVLGAVEAMHDPLAEDGAWLYWQSRARQELARSELDHAMARAGFEQVAAIAGLRAFYPKLAREALGLPLLTPPLPAPLSDEERRAARSHPGLQRALLAFALDLRSEGVREWNYWTNLHDPGGMDDRQLLAAADLACAHEIWDRCINTSERTRSLVSMEQRYPAPFRPVVVRQSSAIGLDPAYVYGLVRQESRFVMAARSHVGASGLMQIMPATARWTARKIGLEGFSPARVNDLETNVLLGTSYLKLVLDDFQASMPMASAAYNAGPRRPRNWREGPVLEGAIWVENIPFFETRDYVKRVLSNTVDYALMLNGQPQSLVARLGSVGPPPPDAPILDSDLP